MHEPTALHTQQLSRRSLIQSAVAISSLALASRTAHAAPDNGVVRSAEAIHQEVFFNATPTRIYDALTDAAQFQKIELLTDAAKTLPIAAHPAIIHREPGSTFSLFGNYIVGRQIELVPGQRITQAWRVESWTPGIFSLVRFAFFAQSSGTKLVFDHVGFPAGTAEHLAAGWYAHYWEPLKKLLS